MVFPEVCIIVCRTSLIETFETCKYARRLPKGILIAKCLYYLNKLFSKFCLMNKIDTFDIVLQNFLMDTR